ncbi:MAG: hypothetical protein R2791_12295 [Saprospiraceae bacterium]|nr:hypothetical protein [Lewinellaceae bacterium]
MHKSRFVNLLRTLEKPELSAFRKYLKCLHANEQTALSLFAYILKFAPVYDDKVKLDLAYAFRKIYRRDIGDERKKMLNALSDLHAWLKAFLMSQKTAGSSFEDRALWLSVLQERRLEAELSRQVQILQHAESAEPVKGAIDYLKNTAVSHFVYYHHVHDNLDSDNRSLREYEKALDLFYAVAKLKIACEALSRQNVLTMQARSGEALPVPDIGDLKDAEQHPLLLLYREAYRLLADGEETAFERCKTLLTKHAAGLAPSETHRLITYLSNYASARLRNGETAYWQKTHELNKLGVKHAAFLREDWMSVTSSTTL